jgi:hypothetical protein
MDRSLYICELYVGNSGVRGCRLCPCDATCPDTSNDVMNPTGRNSLDVCIRVHVRTAVSDVTCDLSPSSPWVTDAVLMS